MPSDDATTCEISILMPCLNEAETLGTCITKAQIFLEQHHIIGEVLVADNGSTDGSQDIAHSLGARLVNVPERGYGAALMGGIVAASSAYILMGDADDSYDFSALLPFVEELRKGADLVMGNRFKGSIQPGAMPFLHRYLGNPLLSSLGSLFFHVPAGDFHCGLRGFRREAILGLGLRTTGMEFASEMVVKAALQRLRIVEVPTVLYRDGRSRRPHLRTWSDGWRHLRFLLLYSPRWLFMYPGLLLILAGLILAGWLITGSKPVGRLVLDVNTLLFAAFGVIIGFQSVTFSLLTKVFAMSEGFLPPDPQFNRWFGKITLERGLLVGSLCVLAGFASSLAALIYWEANSLGPLNPSISLRLVIPGGVLLVVGFQIILSSFFLSILGLKRKL